MGQAALAQYRAEREANPLPPAKPRRCGRRPGSRLCTSLSRERRATRIVAAVIQGVAIDTIARDLFLPRSEVIRIAYAEGIDPWGDA